MKVNRTMRWLERAFAAGLVVGSVCAHAQLELNLRLAYNMVLHMEPIVARVTVDNGTPEELVIGETNAAYRLVFEIEQSPGRPVPRTNRPLFGQSAVAPPYKSVTFEFNLLQLYAIREPGAYTVRARLEGPSGRWVTGKEFLDVVPGLDVAHQVQTLPDGRRMVYQLRSLARDRRQHLLLRVDEETRDVCHGVLDLGTYVRLVEPVMKFDRLGRVHVLHLSGPNRFTHSVFEPDGEPVSAKFWTARPSDIALQRDANGDLIVVGARPYAGDVFAAPSRVNEIRTKIMNRGLDELGKPPEREGTGASKGR